MFARRDVAQEEYASTNREHLQQQAEQDALRPISGVGFFPSLFALQLQSLFAQAPAPVADPTDRLQARQARQHVRLTRAVTVLSLLTLALVLFM